MNRKVHVRFGGGPLEKYPTGQLAGGLPYLAPENYGTWLDTSIQEPEELTPLLVPYPYEQMEAYPVSTHVNKPANDDPDCVEPVGSMGAGSR